MLVHHHSLGQLRWRWSMHTVVKRMKVRRMRWNRRCWWMVTVIADGRTSQAWRSVQEVFRWWWIALSRVQNRQVSRCRTRIVSLVRTEKSRALLLRKNGAQKTNRTSKRWKIWNIITCLRKKNSQAKGEDKTEGQSEEFHEQQIVYQRNFRVN